MRRDPARGLPAGRTQQMRRMHLSQNEQLSTETVPSALSLCGSLQILWIMDGPPTWARVRRPGAERQWTDAYRGRTRAGPLRLEGCLLLPRQVVYSDRYIYHPAFWFTQFLISQIEGFFRCGHSCLNIPSLLTGKQGPHHTGRHGPVQSCLSVLLFFRACALPLHPVPGSGLPSWGSHGPRRPQLLRLHFLSDSPSPHWSFCCSDSVLSRTMRKRPDCGMR